MTWKIVSDSGCDLKQLPIDTEKLTFVRVPLTFKVGERHFIDDDHLIIDEMVDCFEKTDVAATSSCPNPDAYLKAFEGSENIFVVTVTSKLSGSYNSAQLAKNIYLEHHPEANIHVIDSLSAGGEMDLIVLKLQELIVQRTPFQEIVNAITTYQNNTKLIIILEKVDNLVKNGRLNKFLGKMIGLLNIRLIAKADSEGAIALLQKVKGPKKMIVTAYSELQKAGYNGGRVVIAHCQNKLVSKQLAEKIYQDFPEASISIVPASGVCSFYIEKSGILIGYEISR